MDQFIERKIVIGLIVSDRYIKDIYSNWDETMMLSPSARILSKWCIDYFIEFKEAPKKNIESIYLKKLREGLHEDRAKDIEGILSSLSKEWEENTINVDYLLKQTKHYFLHRNLTDFSDDIKSALDKDDTVEAEKIACGYKSIIKEAHNTIDPLNISLDKVKQLFSEAKQPLIELPGAIGKYMNSQLTRESFVSFFGPEKVGKTFWLTEFALQSVMSGNKTVFFQAGDMSEDDLLMRLCVHLAGKSDEEEYCGHQYKPCCDCIHNQTGDCDSSQRLGSGFIWSDDKKKTMSIEYDDLLSKFKEFPDWVTCSGRDCPRYSGSIWLDEVQETNPLNYKEAFKAFRVFRKAYGENMLKLCTYPNESLSITEIENLLDIWERDENFIADVIILDYADLLVACPDLFKYSEYERINKIWQRLRRLAQRRKVLLITASQTDADSYECLWLSKKNFSDTKKKAAHTTFICGLNQTEEEKKLGIMRINDIVKRKGKSHNKNYVTILQCLSIGNPLIGSF